MHTRTHAHTYVCTRVRMYTRMYVHKYIRNYKCTPHISDYAHMYLHVGIPLWLILLKAVSSVIIRAVHDTIVRNNIATQRHRTPTQPQRPLRCFRLFLGERRDDEPLSNKTGINCVYNVNEGWL